MAEPITTSERLQAGRFKIEIDLKTDPMLYAMFYDATKRVMAPTKEEQRSKLAKPWILLRYITQESKEFKNPQRQKLLNSDGTYRVNRRYNSDEVDKAINKIREIRNLYAQKGDFIKLGALCSAGELCLGQSLFASLVMDKLGIPNMVIRLMRKNEYKSPLNTNHAVTVFEYALDGANSEFYYFDSTNGLIVPKEDVKTVYYQYDCDNISVIRRAHK